MDGSNPGTASLEFQGAAPASSGEPDDLIISVPPAELAGPEDEHDSNQGGERVQMGRGSPDPHRWTGTIQCDQATVTGPAASAGSKTVALKITFVYHK